jgi:biopolymer transport protein ExbD
LQHGIAEHLKDRGVERKVYIVADMRAKWGAVKIVLDGVRSAGILRVAFLVDQRRSTASLP